MKKILLFTFILLCSSVMSAQVIADYNLLIVDGYGSTDTQTELATLGHTSTIVNATLLVPSYDFTPYDAILFMYDSPKPPAMLSIINLNISCQLGIVILRGGNVIDTVGLGAASFYSSTDFTIQNNTHWITSVFPLGMLDLGFMYKSNVTTSSPNTTSLGSVEVANGSLVVHDTYKRVVSPYYGHPVGMPGTADASLLLDRIICWAADPCTTAGITKPFTKENSLTVYPNPSIGKFTVEAEGDLSVFNVLGKIIHTQHIEAAAKEVDLTALPSGIYYFQLISEGKILTKKLVKE
ncbi:hypothetical protein BH10BAC1_BH10BAC1_13540 [soil metagenome]